MKYLLIIASLSLFTFYSCKEDSATKKDLNTEEKVQEVKAPIKKNAHDSHEGHDHAKKPEAIENNSRVRVPVEKKNEPKPMPNYKESPAGKTKSKSMMQAEFGEKMQKAVIKLPSACDLMTEKIIAGIVGVEEQSISIKDGSNSSSPYARSCFFRWEHRGVPNSGVLIQIQDNPVPDEFPEWAPYYIQAKKNQGEKSPDGSVSYRYVDFEGLGVDGAYSYDLHRYMWRDDRDYVYMIAFNLPAGEAEELAWAKAIGKEVMKKANF